MKRKFYLLALCLLSLANIFSSGCNFSITPSPVTSFSTSVPQPTSTTSVSTAFTSLPATTTSIETQAPPTMTSSTTAPVPTSSNTNTVTITTTTTTTQFITTSSPPVITPSSTPETSTSVPPSSSTSTTTTQSPTTLTTPPVTPTTTPIVTTTANANQDDIFKDIDQYALNAPASVATSVDSLAAYLIKPAKNDTEKARAIYRWITANISYDVQEFFSGSTGSSGPDDVLTSHSSVCAGYSSLFEALAKAAGLEAVTISGWGKGYGYNVGDTITGEPNHAWNAVKIDGQWYLLDSTWGAGSINDAQVFERDFCSEYFMMPPEQFIYDHFPEDSNWQLLPIPISANEFVNLPYVHSDFFKYGLKLDSNLRSVLLASQNLAITVTAPASVLMNALIAQDNQRLPDTWTLSQRTGDQYQIYAMFPANGTYTLLLFAKQRDDPGLYYDGVVQFKVIVSDISSPAVGFPKTYESFYTNEVYLYTPLAGYLPAGTTVNFQLAVPGAEDVQVVVGDNWYPLTKNGDQFAGIATIAKGPIQVCARFPGNTLYDVLLEYTGQ